MSVTGVAPLATLLFSLPVRLLSLAFGLCIPTFPSAAPAHRARSAAALLTMAALLTVICAIPDAGSSFASEAGALRSEIGELTLKLARLESILEGNSKFMSKHSILEQENKLSDRMEDGSLLLMNEQESSEKFQSKFYSESNIYMMEDELQILQQEVRKINDIAYTIESLAIDAEKRVEFLGSEVKKIDNIIAEQWIQIRQFEQAFVLTKTMTSEVYARRLSESAYKLPAKDIVLKYIRNVDLHDMFLAVASHSRTYVSYAYKHCRNFVQAMNGCRHKASRFHKVIRRRCSVDVDRPNVFFLGGSMSRSCISLPYKQFQISILSAQKFHHKVQVHIEGAMRSNRYSRHLASELITSWLAYLVGISPIWIAWFLFSLRFG